MKATELMIGDWITYHDTNIKMLPLSDNEFTRKKQETFENKHVVGITDDGKVCLRWWNKEIQRYSYYYIDESNIEPIPLTEEILKKNGFEYDSEENEWVHKYEHIGISDFVFRDNKIIAVNKQPINIDAKYVHELQHIFRIFGSLTLADEFVI